MPPKGINQSPCCLCNRRRIGSLRLPPCLLVFYPGKKGKTSVRPPRSQQCAMRAETSVWLRSTSTLKLELLLADSNRISSCPLFYLFRPGPIVPSSGGEMNCKYVMQSGACSSKSGLFSLMLASQQMRLVKSHCCSKDDMCVN